jgi:hypothetical protein
MLTFINLKLSEEIDQWASVQCVSVYTLFHALSVIEEKPLFKTHKSLGGTKIW